MRRYFAIATVVLVALLLRLSGDAGAAQPGGRIEAETLSDPLGRLVAAAAVTGLPGTHVARGQTWQYGHDGRGAPSGAKLSDTPYGTAEQSEPAWHVEMTLMVSACLGARF